MRPIFAGNLEYDTRQSELERLFSKYGRIDRVDMKSGKTLAFVCSIMLLIIDTFCFNMAAKRLSSSVSRETFLSGGQCRAWCSQHGCPGCFKDVRGQWNRCQQSIFFN